MCFGDCGGALKGESALSDTQGGMSMVKRPTRKDVHLTTSSQKATFKGISSRILLICLSEIALFQQEVMTYSPSTVFRDHKSLCAYSSGFCQLKLCEKSYFNNDLLKYTLRMHERKPTNVS